MAVNPEIEPWLQHLANAVQAGYYTFDEAPETPETLPQYRHWLPRGSTPRECYGMLVKLADYFNLTVDEMFTVVFHRGLALYSDDRRYKTSRLGMSPEPAYEEQSRVLNGAYRRTGRA